MALQFSLLTHRTTAAPPDFHDALRRPHLSTGYTNSSTKGSPRPPAADNYPYPVNPSGGMEMSELDGGVHGYQPHQQLPPGAMYPQSPMYGQPPHMQHMYNMYPPQQPHLMHALPPQQYPYTTDPMTPYATNMPGGGPSGANPMQRSWEYHRHGAGGGAANYGGHSNTVTAADIDDERDDADDLPVVEIDLR
jgi:hypothetical protein